MSSERRKYELKKRAATMEETRRRITEAAVELHGTVGPARTTVSAVADRAGVQRHTVYRHFPTERDLFAACSAHFGAMHPGPDPSAWSGLEDGLGQLYAWYEQTDHMWANILRDAELVDAVPEALKVFEDYLEDAGRRLAAGRPRRKVVAAAIAHAVDFRTWRSLVRDGGLSRAQAVELVTAMVDRAARPPRAAGRGNGRRPASGSA
jgi:AcrR family transcriptional regulator